MQDMPPSGKEEKEIDKPGIFSSVKKEDFYCFNKGGYIQKSNIYEIPAIIVLLKKHNEPSDLENFAENFRKNIGAAANEFLKNYKNHLSDDPSLYQKMISAVTKEYNKHKK
jgi:hypothetical protein